MWIFYDREIASVCKCGPKFQFKELVNSSDGRSGQEKLDNGSALEAIIEEIIGQETLDKDYSRIVK
jgi:hypothetical protein